MTDYIYPDVFLKEQTFPETLINKKAEDLPKYAPKPVNDNSMIDFKNTMARIQLRYNNGHVDLESNKKTVQLYLDHDIYPNLIWFPKLIDKINWMVLNNLWKRSLFEKFSYEEVVSVFNRAYSLGYEYKSYLGALMFYNSYSIKTENLGIFLERFEDRAVLTSLEYSSNVESAIRYVENIITGCYQPATPTFANAGKQTGGEPISCFLLDVDDTMNSICNVVGEIMQLSKQGGGIGVNLSNLRETGAPIRGIPGCGNGVIGLAKIIESSLLYSNQAHTRRGAGVVYLDIFHPDAIRLLDSKKEAIDEGSRLKKLSIGLLLPDIWYELLENNETFYAISTYDVFKHYGLKTSDYSMTDYYRTFLADDRIKKYNQGSARNLASHISSVLTQSGYPYLVNIDVVNAKNNIHGRITQSNLCTEIFQVSTLSKYDNKNNYVEIGRDISCNLGSLNVGNCLDNGNKLQQIVEDSVRMLTEVSLKADISCSPSIERGNNLSHSIGLGLMNVHGAFIKCRMSYGDEDSLEFIGLFTWLIRYYALRASNLIAIERKETFFEFEKSKYATGEALQPYLDGTHKIAPTRPKVIEIFKKYNIELPTIDDIIRLNNFIMTFGLFNAYLMAVAPTGNISYINGGTPSATPVVAVIEEREEDDHIGRTHYLPPYLTDETIHLYKGALEIGAYPLIDVYAEITKHIDQGASMTVCLSRDKPDGSKLTTRDISKIMLYARSKEIKSIYYLRTHRDKFSNDDNDHENYISSEISSSWEDTIDQSEDTHDCCSI